MSDLRKNLKIIIASLLWCITLWSCGDSETFTIKGTVDGNANINLRFIYYTNGSLQRGLTAAREGKFEFKGASQTPVMVEILDNDYRPLGRVYVSNGDELECKLTRNAPNAISVAGNDVSERWAAFVNKNEEALAGQGANAVIEEYIAKNPADIVSTLLMLTAYDASQDAARADSVMASISQDVKPAAMVDGFNSLLQRLVTESATDTIATLNYLNMRDSLVDMNPGAKTLSLIVLSDENSGRKDSIVATLRHLNRKALRAKLQTIDISLDRDTATWHKTFRTDTATWQQGWMAGSLASPGIERLGIERLPYFIVTDTAGAQLLRTSSAERVKVYIDSCLTEKN